MRLTYFISPLDRCLLSPPFHLDSIFIIQAITAVIIGPLYLCVPAPDSRERKAITSNVAVGNSLNVTGYGFSTVYVKTAV